MSRIPDPNQTSIALAAQLLLTHFLVSVVAASLFHIFLANLAPLPSLFLATGICGGLGLLLNANIQITLHKLDWVLLRLLGMQPNVPIKPKNHGPLAGIMRKVALLTEKERPFTTQREHLLQQTSEAAAQETRNRLGRDLHDSIKQQLFSINISTAAAQNRLPDNPKDAITILADVRYSTQGALVEMNALLQQLSPAPLEKVGLMQALEDQCSALGYRTGAIVSAKIEPLPEDELFPTGSQEALFRIAQEALSNIARHARAENVLLRLFQEGQNLILDIQDDGLGFEETAVTSGMGLSNMQNRVDEQGGKLKIKTQPHNGTYLQITFPLLPTMSKKEQRMITTDHTYNRFALVGIGGGIALSALLFYPLYQYLPSLFIDLWGGGAALFSSLFGLLSLPLLSTIGYYGAKQFALPAKRQNALSGALATSIAAIIFYFLLGGSAAVIYGSQTLLQQGIVETQSEPELLFYLVESISGVMWAVYAGFWSLLPIGATFGAIGGWFAPLGERNNQNNGRFTPSILMTFPTGIVLSSVTTLIISTTVFSLFSEQVVNTTQEITNEGYTVSLPPEGTFYWPVGTALLIYFLALITAVYLFRYFQNATAPAQKRDYLIQLYWVQMITAVLPFLLLPINSGHTMLRLSMVANFMINLFIVRIINQTEQSYSSKWGQGTSVAPAVLWFTAIVPFILLNFDQLELAVAIGIIGLLVYIATNRRDRAMATEEKTAVKQSRLATAIGSFLPANLTLILPQTPFLITVIGLVTFIVPAIPILSGSELTDSNDLTITLAQRVQELYQLNATSLGIIMIFGTIVLLIMILVLKLSIVWQNRASDR